MPISLYPLINSVLGSFLLFNFSFFKNKKNSEGQAFVIYNVEDFSTKCLRGVFKSDKFSSFIRQLHFYGFSKLVAPLHGKV